jgi:hypothetical protein
VDHAPFVKSERERVKEAGGYFSPLVNPNLDIEVGVNDLADSVDPGNEPRLFGLTSATRGYGCHGLGPRSGFTCGTVYQRLSRLVHDDMSTTLTATSFPLLQSTEADVKRYKIDPEKKYILVTFSTGVTKVMENAKVKELMTEQADLQLQLRVANVVDEAAERSQKVSGQEQERADITVVAVEIPPAMISVVTASGGGGGGGGGGCATSKYEEAKTQVGDEPEALAAPKPSPMQVPPRYESPVAFSRGTPGLLYGSSAQQTPGGMSSLSETQSLGVISQQLSLANTMHVANERLHIESGERLKMKQYEHDAEVHKFYDKALTMAHSSARKATQASRREQSLSPKQLPRKERRKAEKAASPRPPADHVWKEGDRVLIGKGKKRGTMGRLGAYDKKKGAYHISHATKDGFPVEDFHVKAMSLRIPK